MTGKPDRSALPDLADEAPVFAAPWEAQAFALVLALHRGGVFAWSEFAEALGAAIQAAPARPYYESWLAALEALLAARGLAPQAAIDAVARAWHEAARATPHGMPIQVPESALERFVS